MMRQIFADAVGFKGKLYLTLFFLLVGPVQSYGEGTKYLRSLFTSLFYIEPIHRPRMSENKI